MFTCMGEQSEKGITFHENGYMSKTDINIFDSQYSDAVIFMDDFGSLNIFGFKFDKGSALLKETDTLFKLTK